MDFQVNWLAVLACVVANMALGILWYGPLFGKVWMAQMGWDSSKMEAVKKEVNMGMNYGVTTVGALAMALVLARVLNLADWTGTLDWVRSFKIAGAFWLGFVAPVMVGGVLWERKSWAWFALNGGYHLVGLVIMAMILGMWR